MKAISAVTIFLVATLVAALVVPQDAQAAPKLGDQVTITACPHAGIFAACLMIKDADGTLYNITAANPKPPLDGRMIRLRAKVTDKLSMCGAGFVLEAIRWTPTRQKCPN
jgi:hypothetical protein